LELASLMSESRTSPGRVDRWLSIAAGVGAICAVAISLYQAALAREQQRASAWPYLNQSNSFMPGRGLRPRLPKAHYGQW